MSAGHEVIRLPNGDALHVTIRGGEYTAMTPYKDLDGPQTVSKELSFLGVCRAGWWWVIVNLGTGELVRYSKSRRGIVSGAVEVANGTKPVSWEPRTYYRGGSLVLAGEG